MGSIPVRVTKNTPQHLGRSFFAYPRESKIPIPQSGGLRIADGWTAATHLFLPLGKMQTIPYGLLYKYPGDIWLA